MFLDEIGVSKTEWYIIMKAIIGKKDKKKISDEEIYKIANLYKIVYLDGKLNNDNRALELGNKIIKTEFDIDSNLNSSLYDRVLNRIHTYGYYGIKRSEILIFSSIKFEEILNTYCTQKQREVIRVMYLNGIAKYSISLTTKKIRLNSDYKDITENEVKKVEEDAIDVLSRYIYNYTYNLDTICRTIQPDEQKRLKRYFNGDISWKLKKGNSVDKEIIELIKTSIELIDEEEKENPEFIRIEKIGLYSGSVQVLKEKGFNIVRDIIRKGRKDFLREISEKIGGKDARDIIRSLNQRGYKFVDEEREENVDELTKQLREAEEKKRELEYENDLDKERLGKMQELSNLLNIRLGQELEKSDN